MLMRVRMALKQWYRPSGCKKVWIKKIALRNTANKIKMEFLAFGMETSLAQPNVSLIKLLFSSTEIVLV